MTTVLFLGSETWSCRWGVHPFASWSCVTISMALGTITKHDSKNYSRLFKIEHLYFYGLTHIFLFVDKSCFVCVGFINHVNDHYRRGCLHIDAGLQTSPTLTCATLLLWETWPSWCGSGACSGGLNLLCKDYFGHFIIDLLRQFELLMQRLFWTFYYWRFCSEICRRSLLWTETHWTELTSEQWRYFAK